MKLYYTYLVYILSIPFLQAETPIINVTVSQSTSNDLNVKNEQTQKAWNVFYDDQQQVYQNIKTSIMNYIKNNKIQCSCITLSSIYAYISYQIYTNQKVAKDPASWSNWYNNYTIEELFSIPGEKIGNELLHEIQTRYADPDNPTNFIYSLVQFSKIIQTEIEALENQIKIYSWLQTAHCFQIFFVDADAITKIQTKIHKILFLKHIFATWYATYKIERNS